MLRFHRFRDVQRLPETKQERRGSDPGISGKKRVGKRPNSLKLQRVPIEEFSQTFDYGLKDITKLDDFNQVVDWENSSFYQTSTEKLNKT